MPISYLNHYQDSVDRHNEYLDLVNQLAQISQDIGNISSGSNSPQNVILNSAEYIAPLIVNRPTLDLGYLLGNAETGFVNPGGVTINITSPNTAAGNPNLLLNKATGGNIWRSTNVASSRLDIDFGFASLTRQCTLTAIGFKSYQSAGVAGSPVTMRIESSSDNVSWAFVNLLVLNHISDAQWKYGVFNTTPLIRRYYRITQQGLNSFNTNVFACRELRFYGTIFL